MRAQQQLGGGVLAPRRKRGLRTVLVFLWWLRPMVLEARAVRWDVVPA
jgi:hypothetical protein